MQFCEPSMQTTLAVLSLAHTSTRLSTIHAVLTAGTLRQQKNIKHVVSSGITSWSATFDHQTVAATFQLQHKRKWCTTHACLIQIIQCSGKQISTVKAFDSGDCPATEGFSHALPL
jgi:hypothetical protein